MNPSASPAPRAALLAAGAGLAAAVLAQLLGWGTALLLDMAHTAPDANIGAGLAVVLLPLPAAPLLAWPLLRILRLPRPTLTALAGTLLYLLPAAGVLMLWVSATDRLAEHPLLGSVWAPAAANAAVLAAALAAAALFTARRPARDHRGG